MKRLTAAALLALALPAWGDTIKLRNGGTLEGVVLKETDGAVVIRLKYATVTIDRGDIESIEKKASEEGPAAKPARLARWDKCVETVAARPWADPLRQIPATVIDKGILKHVPYMSHKSGNYEFNLYGDPDQPAGLEIGLTKDLLKNEAAKRECLAVIAALLGDAKDAEVLRSLHLAQDKKEREGLTFEVTPETAEDAYGGWWVSVYDVKMLDAARANEEELKAITQDEEEVEKEEEVARKVEPPRKPDPKKPEVKRVPQETIYLWTRKDMQQARPRPRTQRVRRVYVRGYWRPGGVYARPGVRVGIRK